MNDKAQHIDHLIGAYIEDQLPTGEMIRVRKHISQCGECRTLVARHKQISSDLTLVMKHFPPLKSEQVDRMWEGIRQRRKPIRLTLLMPKFVPMLASVVVLLTMLITPLFSISGVAAASTSASVPEIDQPQPPTGMTDTTAVVDIIGTPQPPEQQSIATQAIAPLPQQPYQAVPPTSADQLNQ